MLALLYHKDTAQGTQNSQEGAFIAFAVSLRYKYRFRGGKGSIVDAGVTYN